KLKNNYRFIIIGDGGGIDKLRSVLKENRLESIVELRPPVPRNILVEVYQNSHFLFLHLNNLKAFEKVLPSKLFEYSAFDKPILAGVKGFAQDFIENNVSNSIVFSPTKANELVDKLNKYEYKNVDRSEFVEKFKRENINIDMVKTIVSYAK
ncbi:MAG: glycosyltransferase, partial [Bacteroidales bacterium]|nr:glycosyltransferase [Bacteroidales bacterium]